MTERALLANYFQGVGAKRLSVVEADPGRSNQRELNGAQALRAVLGDHWDEKKYFDATVIYLSDNDPDPVEDTTRLTWYDSRRNKPHRSPEWRLYFVPNMTSACASEGDVLIVARTADDNILLLIVEHESTIANQILWLFGLSEVTDHPGFSVREELESYQDRMSFAKDLILEKIGIETVATEPDLLDQMIRRFGEEFPPARVFSEYARSIAGGLDSFPDADLAMMAWVEKEEILFRTFERQLYLDRVRALDDIEPFTALAKKLLNSRKSRAGLSLENHVEFLLEQRSIPFKRNGRTEGKSTADFLFPSESAYHSNNSAWINLDMLAVKSTLKDRWRQILAEANKIPRKHLLTLEPAITVPQTDEIAERNVQLVLPRPLHSTFMEQQQSQLMSVEEFLKLMGQRHMKNYATS